MTTSVGQITLALASKAAPPLACSDCVNNAGALSGMCGAAPCPLLEVGQGGEWPQAWRVTVNEAVTCARFESAYIEDVSAGYPRYGSDFVSYGP